MHSGEIVLHNHKLFNLILFFFSKFSWNFSNFFLSNLYATGSDSYDDRIALKILYNILRERREDACETNEDG